MNIQKSIRKSVRQSICVMVALLLMVTGTMTTSFAAGTAALSGGNSNIVAQADISARVPDSPQDQYVSVKDGKIVVYWYTPDNFDGIVAYKVSEKDDKLGKGWSATIPIDSSEAAWDEHSYTFENAVIDKVHTYTFVLESVSKSMNSEKAEVEFSTALVGLNLNQYIVDLAIGDTNDSLKVITDPEYAFDKEVIWSSNNEAVAKVVDGKITAVSAGTATITATSTVDKSIIATCIAAVKVPTLLNMSFNGDTKTSIAFDWYTSPKITETVVQVIEKSKLIGDKFPLQGFTTYKGTSTVIKTFMNTDDRDYDEDSDSVKGKYMQFSSHKAIADKLKPGTLYAYRAGNGDEDGWSQIGSFTTDAEGNQPFHFAVTTDTQGSEIERFNLWQDTFKTISEKINPKFVALTGDMTDDGDIEKTMQWFLGIPEKQFANTPFAPVFGSHETNDESNPSNNFFYHYNVPKDVGIGYRTTYGDRENPNNFGESYEDGSVYSFEYGDALFMMFNGQYEGKLIDNNDPSKGVEWVDPQFTAQLDWMKKQVANSDKKWKFVLMHKGPFSAGDNADGEWGRVVFTRHYLAPLLNQLGVDVVFEGHDHMYMRSHQMLGDKIADKNIVTDEYGNVVDPSGTLYMMTGTAAAKFYEKNEHVDDYFAKIDVQTFKKMFVDVSVTDDVLKLTTYTAVKGEDISVYDTYSIKKTTGVKKDFTDMGEYQYAEAAAEKLAGDGIISGTSETTFEPGKNITRADFINSLVKGLKLTAEFDSNFTDVKNIDDYYTSIGIARKLGITNGVGNNEFNPMEEITKQDMMVMLAKALKGSNKDIKGGTAADIKGFTDYSQVSNYALLCFGVCSIHY